MVILAVPGAGEKRRPQHDLASFKAVFAKDRPIVETARRDALKMGMTIDDAVTEFTLLSFKEK